MAIERPTSSRSLSSSSSPSSSSTSSTTSEGVRASIRGSACRSARLTPTELPPLRFSTWTWITLRPLARTK